MSGANSNRNIEEWKALPWKKFQRVVFRLQCRIYKAQRNGDSHLVKKLQNCLLNSRAAKFLAVRQIIQLNSGKKTAGVDGISTVSIKNRVKFAESINLKTWEHQQLRRVYLPKPNGDKRPLGIPTIYDRVCQCITKYALEPCIEPTSAAGHTDLGQVEAPTMFKRWFLISSIRAGGKLKVST